MRVCGIDSHIDMLTQCGLVISYMALGLVISGSDIVLLMTCSHCLH